MSADDLKIGLFMPFYPLNEALATARFAEAKGFDSVWTADHIVGIRSRAVLDPWLIQTVAANETRRIRLGFGVTDIYRRHPATLVQTATTLDVVSGGRLILGIGAGEAMNLTPYGIDWEKKAFSRMREAILVMKKLWTGQFIDYDGEFFKMHNAIVALEPVQKPNPPIWLGAYTPRTLKLVGEIADGWLPIFIPPETYQSAWEQIRQTAADFNRDPDAIEPGLFLCTAAADSRDLAREKFTPSAKVWLIMFPKLLRLMGAESHAQDEYGLSKFVFTPSSAEKLIQESKNIPTELVEKTCAVGTADDCIEKIESFIKSGVRHFALMPLGDSVFIKEQTQRLYAEKIVPYFKGK
ncbi:MAG: LLM class flavin-dependent oxidoreductase [Candidatus Bathyarchaeia archaeon]